MKELDYKVAQFDKKCEGLTWEDQCGMYAGIGDGQVVAIIPDNLAHRLFAVKAKAVCYSPSTNWSQGGPLIEEYKIDIYYDEIWFATCGHLEQGKKESGETPLIAAMKALAAHKEGLG